MESIFHVWRRRGSRLLAALLLAAVAACGGGSGDAEGPQDTAVLAGNSAAAALSALVDIEPTPAASQDIAGAYLLTRISVVLKPDATVEDLNSAARAVGATAISFSRPGSPFITLAVPRQDSGAALTELARQLESQPGILFASAGRRIDTLEVPTTEGVVAQLQELDHLLATRFPSSWNVRNEVLTPQGNCLSKVTVIVPDYYFGKPANFDDQMEGSVSADPLTREPVGEEVADPHGYNVVATLAAKFDKKVSTGANPAPKCLQIKLVDVAHHTGQEVVAATIAAVRREPGRVILSSSVGYNKSSICGSKGKDDCTFPEIALQKAQLLANTREQFVQGIQWAEFAMQPDVVDRVLIVQAAGNDADKPIGFLYAGLRSASLGSAFAIATVLADLDAVLTDTTRWRPPVQADQTLPYLSLSDITVAELRSLRDRLVTSPVTDRNLLLVGGTTNRKPGADVARYAATNDGAAMFAVAEGITTVDDGVKEGTSYAAPQVAGLVSYLWLLEPTLVNRPLQDTIRAIQDNKQINPTLKGIVDAYATILSLDRSVAPMPGTSRMRLGILDLDGDGDFDLEDLRKFHAAYIDSGLALEPVDPDYSRFDLNGDGFTGGARTVAMDLDPSTSTQFGARVLSEVILAVGGVERPFDENAVTDAQVLCYYASTALFTGTDLAARDALLGELCPLKLSADLPASVAGGADLEVIVEAPARGATFVPVANVLISFAPTCATIDQLSGRSDSAGRISVRVTPNPDCTTVSVAITVTAEVGTPVLAREEVTATAAALSVEGLYSGTVTRLDKEGAPANAVTKSIRQSGARIAVFDFNFGREGTFGLVFELALDGTLTFLGQAISRDGFNFTPMREVVGVTGSLVGGRLQYLMIVTDSEVTDRVVRDEYQHDLRRQP